jgi:hypothetical protein
MREEIEDLKRELAAETRRRKFMQVHGRYLGWGNIGRLVGGKPDWSPPNVGVMFTADGWMRPYHRFQCGVSYLDGGWDGKNLKEISEDVRCATERLVIDKAIAEYEKAAADTEQVGDCAVSEARNEGTTEPPHGS